MFSTQNAAAAWHTVREYRLFTIKCVTNDSRIKVVELPDSEKAEYCIWREKTFKEIRMTEQEWQACTDPDRMLEFLIDKASERKRRLFAVACCRRIWHLVTDERSRRGVEIAERGADSQASDQEILAGCNAAHEVFMEAKRQEPFNSEVATIAFAAYGASGGHTESHAAWCAAESLAYRAGVFNDGPWEAAFQAERAVQCDLLRELFGKPFGPITVPSSWLSWNDGEIPKLAQEIYQKRNWEALPRLANALEAAGCQDEEILAHCGQSSKHVRGCWVVDALLGREPAIKMGLTSHQAWQTCSEPTPLLAFLKDRATDRKWRLFSVACCRRIWHLITDERGRNAVEMAERFANRQATEEELGLARTAANEAEEEAHFAKYCAESDANFCYTAEYCRIRAVLFAIRAAKAAVSIKANEPDRGYPLYRLGRGGPWGSWDWATAAAGSMARSNALASMAIQTNEVGGIAETAEKNAEAAETTKQADLIRDVFGNLIGSLTESYAWLPWKDGTDRWSLLPSKRAVTIDHSWLEWADGLVVKLASGIDDEQAFDRLPILADALEDAGCTNGDILAHCRQPEEHVRGCWVIDFLLAKE